MNKCRCISLFLVCFIIFPLSSCSVCKNYFDKSIFLFPSDLKKTILNDKDKSSTFLTVQLDSEINQNVKFCIAGKLRKFFFYTDVDVHKGINYVSLNTRLWFSGLNDKQNPSGFKIESLNKINVLSAEVTANNISNFYVASDSIKEPYLTIYYADDYYSQGQNGNQNRVDFSVAHYDLNNIQTRTAEKFSLRNSPRQTQVDFAYGSFNNLQNFKTGKTSLDFFCNADKVKYLVLHENHIKHSKKESIEKLLPVTADPGLIVQWNINSWRTHDFELFSWQQIPDVLIFDFKDYDTQDKYLKRLAFFVEKTDFAGRVVSFEEVKDIHGFNAHDYRAESLADFFNAVKKQDNNPGKEESLLLKILLENQIITENASHDFLPGKGAIISISQESPEYLRNSLLSHEGFHGIYFTDESFRNCVSKCFDETDAGEKEFILKYFDVTPSLRYNMNDSYLIQNEFMGYTMQQSVKNTRRYFAENLTSRYYINQYAPDLVEYMKKRQAASLVEKAKVMDDFVFTGYGLNAGRIFLVLRLQD